MDKTLFILNVGKDTLLVQIYVNDIIFCSTNKDLCQEFAKSMQKEFEISMMGELSYFLGLQIQQNSKGTFINQAKYTKELIKKFGLDDAKACDKQMATTTKLNKYEFGKPVEHTLYRGMIGSLFFF